MGIVRDVLEQGLKEPAKSRFKVNCPQRASSEGNLVSDNFGGIIIVNRGATDNLVQGNIIGTDVTGTVALGNGVGVDIYGGASDNTIGGTDT